MPLNEVVVDISEASEQKAAGKGHCVFYVLFAGIHQLPGHGFPNYADMIDKVRHAVRNGEARLESVLCGREKLAGAKLIAAQQWVDHVRIDDGYMCSTADALLIAYCCT